MNKRGAFLIVVLSLIISSCSSSRKVLMIKNDEYSIELTVLKNKNKTLIIENQNLVSEVISLKNALEESKNQIAPDNKVTPNIENNDYSIKSNLSDLESYFKKDSRLSNKFRSFKQAGIERRLNVSYSQMMAVIKEAEKYIGTKHVMGGLSRNGIDCSGLLYVSFQANGITNIPRTAENFARYGTIILNTNDIQKGDLVFFTNTYSTSKLVTHAGICTGNGNFIHTSSSKGVMISKLNDPYYWREKFLFGTRIIQ